MKNLCLILTALLLAGVVSCQPAGRSAEVDQQDPLIPTKQVFPRKATIRLVYEPMMNTDNIEMVRFTMHYAIYDGEPSSPGLHNSIP